MPKKARRPGELPTIWRVPDDLWEVIEPVLAEYDPPKPRGRKRINQRAALDAIIFRLRSGCQWNQLPKEFPDDSSVHRTFQRWRRRRILDRIWALLVEDCDDLGGVDWEWQAADGMLGKARFGGASSDRTPPTVPRTAPRRACWWTATVGRWPW